MFNCTQTVISLLSSAPPDQVHSVWSVLHAVNTQTRHFYKLVCALTFDLFTSAPSGPCGSHFVCRVGRDGLPEGEWALQPPQGRLHPGRTPCAGEVTFRPAGGPGSESSYFPIDQHICPSNTKTLYQPFCVLIWDILLIAYSPWFNY